MVAGATHWVLAYCPALRVATKPTVPRVNLGLFGSAMSDYSRPPVPSGRRASYASGWSASDKWPPSPNTHHRGNGSIRIATTRDILCVRCTSGWRKSLGIEVIYTLAYSSCQPIHSPRARCQHTSHMVAIPKCAKAAIRVDAPPFSRE